MSDDVKTMIAATISVATVMMFVLPRQGTSVPSTIRTISKYVTGSINSLLGQ